MTLTENSYSVENTEGGINYHPLFLMEEIQMSFNKENNKYEGWIYFVTNLVNNKKYIGQTTVTINSRWNQHISKSNNNPDTVIDTAIAKYGKDNFIVEELDFISTDTKEELIDKLNGLEIYYIQRYSSLVSQYGYNVDKGGQSGVEQQEIPIDCYYISGEFIKTFKNKTEAAEFYGIHEDTVRSIYNGSKPNYNYTIVFRKSGEPFDKYNHKSNQYREIYKWTTDGVLLKKYYSRHEAIGDGAVKFFADKIDDIYCTAGGYWYSSTPVFSYVGAIKANAKKKKIYVYDVFGILENIYESKSVCARALDTTRNSITDNCNGHTLTIKGKICRYEGEPFDKYLDWDELQYYIDCFTRPIDKYSQDGVYLGDFDSIHVASSEYKKKSLKNIYDCCVGSRNWFNGVTYRFKGDCFDCYKNLLNKFDEPINMYTTKNEFVKTFYYTDEVRDYFDITDINSIYYCLSGAYRTAYKHKWYHSSNPNQPDKSKIITNSQEKAS